MIAIVKIFLFLSLSFGFLATSADAAPRKVMVGPFVIELRKGEHAVIKSKNKSETITIYRKPKTPLVFNFKEDKGHTNDSARKKLKKIKGYKASFKEFGKGKRSLFRFETMSRVFWLAARGGELELEKFRAEPKLVKYDIRRVKILKPKKAKKKRKKKRKS